MFNIHFSVTFFLKITKLIFKREISHPLPFLLRSEIFLSTYYISIILLPKPRKVHIPKWFSNRIEKIIFKLELPYSVDALKKNTFL